MSGEEIRKLMHECVDVEHPHLVVTKEETHRMVDEIYDTYVKMIPTDSRKEDVYYIHMEDYPWGHPAGLIGTFMVLLLAGVKKIWVEEERSFEGWCPGYSNDVFSEEILGKMLDRFPQLCLRKNLQWNLRELAAFDFVNHKPEITHVIEFGRHTGIYWRIPRYRKDVKIHIPTAVQVWVDYTSTEELQEDELFEEFGEHCFLGLFDYECQYSKHMKDAYSDAVYVGMCYENCWDWNEFVQDELRWRESTPNVQDVTPVYLFGNEQSIAKCLETMPKEFRPITKETFSFRKIDYDFLDLLR